MSRQPKDTVLDADPEVFVALPTFFLTCWTNYLFSNYQTINYHFMCPDVKFSQISRITY